MSTTSLLGVQNIARTRLLTYTPSSGSTLATLLGSTSTGAGSDGKLYLNQAPDSVRDEGGFWGILRLIDAPQQGMDGGYLIRGQFELILYGRPRRQQSAVERMADVVEEAWLSYQYVESGKGTFLTDRTTNRFPIPYEAPADRELVAVRMLLPFRTTPAYLTSHAA